MESANLVNKSNSAWSYHSLNTTQTPTGSIFFEQEEGQCSVCSAQRSLRYTSSFYSVEEPEYLCPWCIADGSAAAKYNGEFNDYAGIEGVSVDPASTDETTIPKALLLQVSERTPSYSSWQQEVWLTHCGEPCAFIDYADAEMIAPLLKELQDDIATIEHGFGVEPKYLLECLNSGGLAGYLFRCVICGQHRLHTDCD